MWEIIKNILTKKACFHEWKLVKEDRIGIHYHYIYICQKCGKIKVIEIKQIMTREDKEQECKKCGRVFGSVRCFDVDCPNNTPNYYKQHTKNNNIQLWFVQRKIPYFFI